MEYVPTKITLTRKVGFSEAIARGLRKIAEFQNKDPRQLACEMLLSPVQRELFFINEAQNKKNEEN